MISNETISDDRVHLTADESLLPIPHDKPKQLNATKTDILLLELTDTNTEKKLVKKIRDAVFPILVVCVMAALAIMIIIYNRFLKAGTIQSDECYDPCQVELLHESNSSAVIRELMSSAALSIDVLSKGDIPPIENAPSELGLIISHSSLSTHPPAEHTVLSPSLLLTSEMTACWWRSSAVKPVIITTSTAAGGWLRDDLLSAGAVVIDNHPIYLHSSELSKNPIIPILSQIALVDGRDIILSNRLDASLLQPQVRLSGILMRNCSCVAMELKKILELEKTISQRSETVGSSNVPIWLQPVNSKYNLNHTMQMIEADNSSVQGFGFAHSLKKPHDFNRSNELDTVFQIMNSSNSWVYLSLSSYIPGIGLDTDSSRFWPLIDNFIRQLLFESHSHVTIRIILHTDLDGSRNTSRLSEYHLRSLESLSPHIHLKVITEAADSTLLFILSESSFYYGTADWTGDYFKDPHVAIGLTGTYRNQSKYPSIGLMLKNYHEQIWDAAS